ncbi:hypothetical protein GGR50DRAFT_644814 [Xylaria sp. CBS 124048]|nr:hypothetical protein GGR50DRAFT_644814 [Xylaria sp. CBS 124048]
MCQYYYLHYHHVAPCQRSVDFFVHYTYCINAKVNTNTTSSSTTTNTTINTAPTPTLTPALEMQPCDDLSPALECDPATGISLDYTNPCAAGGCLISQHCSSGGCRLEDVGGKWVCCRCGGGGNTFRWCMRPLRAVPDSLCYHVVCRGCRADRTRGEREAVSGGGDVAGRSTGRRR